MEFAAIETEQETVKMPTESPAQIRGNATLSFDGRSVDLPLLTGTESESAINIEKLRAQTSLITLDPGYGNTGSCKSAITFIDGEKGILRYRGYPIDEPADQATFLEVPSLQSHAELPTQNEYDQCVHHITFHTYVHKNLKDFMRGFHYDAHPMSMLT